MSDARNPHPRSAADAPEAPGQPGRGEECLGGDSGRTEAVEEACVVMHDAYERAAVGTGWETNPASRKPWADVPEANKETMRAAVGALLDHLAHDEDAKARRLGR